jgi:tetratricopeptide (TPR) repeat protein
MRHAIVVLALCCCSWLPAHAQAPLSCDPSPEAPAAQPAADRIRDLVRQKRFEAVEDEIADKLRRYERREYSDLDVYGTINRAMVGDMAAEPLLTQWVNEQPRSFVARLLRAAHHVNAGYSRRGNKMADQTSAEQFQAMELAFRSAAGDLRAAMDLRPNSALPHAWAIQIARSVAGPEAVQTLLAEATRVDPRHSAARYAVIWGLEPRWGGSFEHLDALVADIGASALPEPRRRYLRYMVEMRKGAHFQDITREKTKAGAHYRQAGRICASSNAWWLASTMAYDLEDWSAVVDAASEYVALRPDSARGWSRRGWAKEKMGRVAEAVADYEKSATLNEPWAQNKLGYALMTGQGGVARDLGRARELLRASAAAGNASARQSLDWLERQPR